MIGSIFDHPKKLLGSSMQFSGAWFHHFCIFLLMFNSFCIFLPIWEVFVVELVVLGFWQSLDLIYVIFQLCSIKKEIIVNQVLAHFGLFFCLLFLILSLFSVWLFIRVNSTVFCFFYLVGQKIFCTSSYSLFNILREIWCL